MNDDYWKWNSEVANALTRLEEAPPTNVNAEEICVCIAAEYAISNNLMAPDDHMLPAEITHKMNAWFGFNFSRVYSNMLKNQPSSTDRNCTRNNYTNGHVILCPPGYPPDPSFGIKWNFEKKGGTFTVWSN